MLDNTLLSPNDLARGRKAAESSGADVCLEWQVTPGKFLMVAIDNCLRGLQSSMLNFEDKY